MFYVFWGKKRARERELYGQLPEPEMKSQGLNFRKSTCMLASGLWFKHREIVNTREQAFFALRI